MSKFNKIGFAKYLITFFISLLFLFFAFESLAPLNSNLNLFKGAYGVEYSLTAPISPEGLIFDKDYYEVESGKYIEIKFSFAGNENCDRGILFNNVDNDIVLVCSSISKSIYVTGVKQGTTSFSVCSRVNKNVSKKITINVLSYKDLSFKGLKTPDPCYSMNDNLVYDTKIKYDYQNSLKLNYLPKNSDYVVMGYPLTFETNESDVVDENGNINYLSKYFGKDIDITVFSNELTTKYGLDKITYTIHFNYPPIYGKLVVSQFWLNFVLYILGFVVFGFFFSELFSYINFHSPNIKKTLICSILSLLFSLTLLLIEYFVLNKPFAAFYFLVSPIVCLITIVLLDTEIRNKIISFFRRIFQNEK